MVGFMFLLAGCGSAVSVSDLKANDWLVDTKDDETPNMIVSFSDHIMSFKVDMSSIGSSAEDEWEALGEELAKQIFDQMNFKLEYELNKDELKVQDADDNKEYVYYKVTKEDKNIVLTPDKEKNTDDDQEKLVLEPYDAPKEKDSSTAQSSSANNTETSQLSTELYGKAYTGTAKKSDGTITDFSISFNAFLPPELEATGDILNIRLGESSNEFYQNMTFSDTVDGCLVSAEPLSGSKDSEPLSIEISDEGDQTISFAHNDTTVNATYDSEYTQMLAGIDEEVASFSYNDKVFSTDKGTITITGVKHFDLVESDAKGIFLEFDFENTTEENQSAESTVWSYLEAKQVFKDTTEHLQYANFYEDSPNYERFHKSEVETNPGATIQAGYGFILLDPEYPLTIDFLNGDYDTIATENFN